MKLGIEKPGSCGHTSRISAPLPGADTGLLFGPGSTGDIVVLFDVLALRKPLFRRERAQVATVGFETECPRKYPAMVLLFEKLIKIDIHGWFKMTIGRQQSGVIVLS